MFSSTPIRQPFAWHGQTRGPRKTNAIQCKYRIILSWFVHVLSEIQSGKMDKWQVCFLFVQMDPNCRGGVDGLKPSNFQGLVHVTICIGRHLLLQIHGWTQANGEWWMVGGRFSSFLKSKAKWKRYRDEIMWCSILNSELLGIEFRII